MTDALIRADALTKIVQSGDNPLTILDNVSFAVEAGASIAIVGASGSGKTTLLGLLAGLDRPTSGEVHVDGRALSTLDEDARAALRQRLLGFVFQSFQLLPALTALENVMLPSNWPVPATPSHGRACGSSAWDSPGASLTIRASSLEASSNAWRSRARSPASRNS